MTHSVSTSAWINWAGSAAVIAMIAASGAAQAAQNSPRQDPPRQAQPQQSGMAPMSRPGEASGITGGAVAGIVVARTPEQTACDSGTARACRTIEAGLVTGGAWSFVDGGVTAMDDWESPVARQASAPPAMSSSSSQVVRGNHIPQAVLTHRVLAACDGGDVSACRAFSASVRPSTASERTEQRTYTAGH